MLDADEAAVGKFFDVFHHDGEIKISKVTSCFLERKDKKLTLT